MAYASSTSRRNASKSWTRQETLTTLSTDTWARNSAAYALDISKKEENVLDQCGVRRLRTDFEFCGVSCTRFRRHQVRCFMEQEVCHGEKAVYAGVQA